MSVKVLVTQSCPTLCDPMDCSPPASSVHGISQVRVLEWVAISSSRGSCQPRNWTPISCVSCIASHQGSLIQSCIEGFFVRWFEFDRSSGCSFGSTAGKMTPSNITWWWYYFVSVLSKLLVPLLSSEALKLHAKYMTMLKSSSPCGLCVLFALRWGARW